MRRRFVVLSLAAAVGSSSAAPSLAADAYCSVIAIFNDPTGEFVDITLDQNTGATTPTIFRTQGWGPYTPPAPFSELNGSGFDSIVTLFDSASVQIASNDNVNDLPFTRDSLLSPGGLGSSAFPGLPSAPTRARLRNAGSTIGPTGEVQLDITQSTPTSDPLLITQLSKSASATIIQIELQAQSGRKAQFEVDSFQATSSIISLKQNGELRMLTGGTVNTINTFVETGGLVTQTGGDANSGATLVEGGQYNMSGGTADVSSALQIIGGTFTASSSAAVNAANMNIQSSGLYSQTGGTLTVTGNALVGLGNNNFGRLRFTGGTASVGTMLVATNFGSAAAQGRLDVSNGTMGVNALRTCWSQGNSGEEPGPIATASASINLVSGALRVSSFTALHGQTILSYTGGTFSAGSLSVNGPNARIILSGTSNKVIEARTLSFDATGGAIDLGNGAMIITPAAIVPPQVGPIAQFIANGHNGGDWLGDDRAIFSTNAANAVGSSIPTAVGVALSSQVLGALPASFAGRTVTAPSVLVRYTLAGDTNLDLTVNISDFANLASNFNGTNKVWFNGDFNYDGTTNISDFAVLAANFNRTLPSDLPRQNVPEPAGIAVILVSAMILRSRRLR